MTTTEIPAKPLWRCVLRKSASVTEKMVLWASYCVCGITALALAAYGALALYSVTADPIRAFLIYIVNGVSFAGSLAAMVPWYAYVGAVAVAALKGVICTRCPVGKECGAQDEDHRLGSLIMCISHGPVDYCDEDYFTEVPILGDSRFIGARERDE